MCTWIGIVTTRCYPYFESWVDWLAARAANLPSLIEPRDFENGMGKVKKLKVWLHSRNGVFRYRIIYLFVYQLTLFHPQTQLNASNKFVRELKLILRRTYVCVDLKWSFFPLEIPYSEQFHVPLSVCIMHQFPVALETWPRWATLYNSNEMCITLYSRILIRWNTRIPYPTLPYHRFNFILRCKSGAQNFLPRNSFCFYVQNFFFWLEFRHPKGH